MEEFIEYQRFPTLDDVTYLIDLLDANQVPFKIDDSETRFEIAATTTNPLERGIVLLIRASDKARVDQLNFKTAETASTNDHYMHSLSDNDILDVIVNPEDWTAEEISLAKDISKQRNLTLSGEIIKSLRKDKNTLNSSEQTKQKSFISGGISWFLWIGILSALNIVAVILHQNISFITGLGLNYAILGIMEGIRRASGTDLTPLGFCLTFILSGFFIWIWRKSKQRNKKFYLTGLIIYGIDTIIYLFMKQWFGLAFHFLALSGMYYGYKALLQSELKKADESD